MSEVIAGLAPAALWERFAEIAAIPRPSKREERIAEYVVALARKSNLEHATDTTGNIVVRKPASRGRESSPGVVLQSHLDMVCEKNKDVQHNFDTDGIRLVRSNGYVTAQGTTLGADNGIGVAAALAVMLDSSLTHGPLEFLFTVDEETGLTGAHGLQPGFLKSRILLNLDSEEDGALYVGCSGGRDTLLVMPVGFETIGSDFVPMLLSVGGLKGGHSGLDINTGRGNAIKMLARAVAFIGQSVRIRVANLEGGSKRNAIPREAEAHVYIPVSEKEKAQSAIAQLNDAIRNELSAIEPNLQLNLQSSTAGAGQVLITSAQQTVIDLLYAIPHGVIAMSPDIPGLVETSTNLATIQTSLREIRIGTSQRSSVNSALDDLAARVQAIGRLAGTATTTTDGYPGWKPNLESHILKVTKQTHKQIFGVEPAVKAIHAGLECGIIGEKYPGIDMVSFGPTIEGAHSPDERVEIATVEKFWRLLVSILKNLS